MVGNATNSKIMCVIHDKSGNVGIVFPCQCLQYSSFVGQVGASQINFFCRMSGFRRINWTFVRLSAKMARSMTEIAPDSNPIR